MSIDQLLPSLSILAIFSPELAAFNALDLKNNLGGGISLFGIDKKVSFDNLTGEIKLFI